MKKTTLTLDGSNLSKFISKEEHSAMQLKAVEANKLLHSKKGKGNDFLGWIDVDKMIPKSLIDDIKATANQLKSISDVVVVIGIGGSYLGAKAVIDALSNSFANFSILKSAPHIVYAGHNMSETYMAELLAFLKGKRVSTIIISKSGTTTEPAIAFRIIKNLIEFQHKGEAKQRIVAITDASKGALLKVATKEGYKTFVIPDNVGGRFSVLTPVGLLAIAVAGGDIDALVEGAKAMEKATDLDVSADANIAIQYATIRNVLYDKGKKIEVLGTFEPKLQYFSEWWKQLFGESEGKENKGIFLASVLFSTDLHSMGQYLQQGERHLFETILNVQAAVGSVVVTEEAEDHDELNYLQGKSLTKINEQARIGTLLAHTDGDVPNIVLNVTELTAFSVGELIYFFEKSVGISGYMLGVNPFDQPGVEDYKSNMFALLEKPGFEKQTEAIKKKLGK